MYQRKFLKIRYHVEDDEIRCSSDYTVMISLEDLVISEDELNSKKNRDYLKAICLRLARINGHTWKYTEVEIEDVEIIKYELKEIIPKQEDKKNG